MTDWQLTAPPEVPIFEGVPKDWRELQSLVALLFTGMGCTAEVEKSVHAARGFAELDVVATDMVSGHKITYVCECKLWGKPVSQHVVHGFRSVVADIGADIGIIISAKGFQRGAVAAATLTNIRLLTWGECQRTFEDRWTAAKIREVDAYAARVVACTKKMPGFPNTATRRLELPQRSHLVRGRGASGHGGLVRDEELPRNLAPSWHVADLWSLRLLSFSSRVLLSEIAVHGCLG